MHAVTVTIILSFAAKELYHIQTNKISSYCIQFLSNSSDAHVYTQTGEHSVSFLLALKCNNLFML